jgi:ankyrin repeat protein
LFVFYVFFSPHEQSCRLRRRQVELLVREGATLDFESFSGRTALVECAKHGSVEPLRYLVEAGATLALVTAQKATAFDWALNSGQPRALRHLVREYRVQKDLARLFRLVMLGDAKAVREVRAFQKQAGG